MTEPSRLLAGRPGLSRPEKDAILDAVIARVEAPRGRRARWLRRLAIGAVTVAAAAGALLVLRPAPGPRPDDEFTARGGGQPAGFAVTCVPAPCAVGSKLVFDVTATGRAAYVAAFARSAERIIWYFPSTADGRSRPLPPGGGVLDTGILIGAEHAPGSYAIEAVFSPVPLDRAQVRAAVERGEAVERPVIVR